MRAGTLRSQPQGPGRPAVGSSQTCQLQACICRCRRFQQCVVPSHRMHPGSHAHPYPLLQYMPSTSVAVWALGHGEYKFVDTMQ